MTAIQLGRFAIAMVWIYQGLWCKVMGRVPRHAAVLESTPLFGSTRAATNFLVGLGVFETLLGIWVATGVSAYACAVVQICLLTGMNAGGLLWARAIIPEPLGMVFQNFALLVLIWICG